MPEDLEKQNNAAEGFYSVGVAEDFPVGAVHRVLVNNKPIALANINGAFYAFEDRCLHWGVRLSDGEVEGSGVRCRAHGWVHDVVRGEISRSIPSGDEGSRIRRFATKVEGEFLMVSLEPVK